jgi:hypothetical protein
MGKKASALLTEPKPIRRNGDYYLAYRRLRWSGSLFRYLIAKGSFPFRLKITIFKTGHLPVLPRGRAKHYKPLQ